jgi:uncharacterized membrane protein
MSIAQFAPAALTRGPARWLLLCSLALNLFFVGVAVAMAVRAPAPPAWDRNVFVRIDHLAATLPPADAAILHAQIAAHRGEIVQAQAVYHTAQDQIHETLRQDPFSADALRAAMARTRTTRQAFDQVIQGVFATIAERISPAGRHALADWPPGRKTSSNNG